MIHTKKSWQQLYKVERNAKIIEKINNKKKIKVKPILWDPANIFTQQSNVMPNICPSFLSTLFTYVHSTLSLSCIHHVP